MPTVTQETIDKIKEFEGFRENAYRDPAGVWTIGYGFTAGVRPGDRITREEADIRFQREINQFAEGVRAQTGGNITDNEFSAFVSLAYNIGLGAFAGSTALRRFKAGDKAGAAAALQWWNKATVNGRKVELRGLTRRRAWEAELFLRPVVGTDASAQAEGDDKSLTRSRTMGGAALVALSELAHQAAAEVEPFAAQSEVMRYIFAGLTLLGVGIIIYARFDDWRRGKR